VIEAIGNLHPFLVHFPVALILCAAGAEGAFVARRDTRWGNAARVMLLLAAWISIPAAAAGFAAASGESFSPEMARVFSIHRIAGISTPVLVVLAAGLAEGSRRSGQIWELFLYRIILVLAVISVLVAGIAGGELVHGLESH
jgi:uncharacterized membrane protein